jgi:hypothetical protein
MAVHATTTTIDRTRACYTTAVAAAACAAAHAWALRGNPWQATCAGAPSCTGSKRVWALPALNGGSNRPRHNWRHHGGHNREHNRCGDGARATGTVSTCDYNISAVPEDLCWRHTWRAQRLGAALGDDVVHALRIEAAF